jgi:hypothetical protein
MMCTLLSYHWLVIYIHKVSGVRLIIILRADHPCKNDVPTCSGNGKYIDDHHDSKKKKKYKITTVIIIFISFCGFATTLWYRLLKLFGNWFLWHEKQCVRVTSTGNEPEWLQRTNQVRCLLKSFRVILFNIYFSLRSINQQVCPFQQVYHHN